MNKPHVKSNSVYKCIRILHISAASNTLISVILSVSQCCCYAAANVANISNFFHSPVTWAEIPNWFIFWGVWECDGMPGITAGSSLRGRIDVVTQTPELFVAGLMCNLELRLFMKEWESANKKAENKRRGASHGLNHWSLPPPSAKRELTRFLEWPGVFTHPRMRGWILTAYE